MRLPPPTSVNPRALADQIRQALKKEEPAAPVETPAASLHMIAAAKTAISWIRARRTTWATEPAGPVIETVPVNVVPAGAPAYVVDEEPAVDPSAVSPAADSPLEAPGTIAAWLPLVALIVAAALLIWAVISFW